MQIAKNGGLPFKKTAMYSTVRNHFSELEIIWLKAKFFSA
jgi:hypothetical protein